MPDFLKRFLHLWTALVEALTDVATASTDSSELHIRTIRTRNAKLWGAFGDRNNDSKVCRSLDINSICLNVCAI
jgi:hypothetical protein